MPDSFESKFKKDSKTYEVYKVLKNLQWHCRECEYIHVGTSQIAGGAGIQGLQRGSSNRDGMVIESENRQCNKCSRSTRQDKWSGEFHPALTSKSIPLKFQSRVLALLDSKDIVEMRKRPLSQITIDHKLPMIRWNQTTKIEQTNYNVMTNADIKQNFQLLKKSNGSVSHNLLKSRACESCFRNKKRGTPFGIFFFYSGNEDWIPEDDDPKGCIGCGWHDFGLWRTNLNNELRKQL